MSEATISRTARPRVVSSGRVRPWLGRAALIGLSAAVLIPLYLYWQESALRAARRDAAAGDVRQAFSRVSYFLDSHPAHGDALALKARLLVQLGRTKEAIEIFDQVGAANAVDMHAWSRAYLLEGRYSHAMPLLAQVLELDPANADATYELAATNIRLGLLEEAVPIAERFAAMPGQEAKARVMLATVYNDRGNHARAAVEYGKVLQLVPDVSNLQFPAAEVLFQYGTVLGALGQTEKAVGMLERSAAAQPDAATYVALGNAYAQLGQDEEAQRAWKTALEVDPPNRPAREALANGALQEARADVALDWLKPLEKRGDLSSSTAYLFQRTFQALKDQAASARWKKKADELRDVEQLNTQIDLIKMNAPRSFRANVLRAYQFALAGNWEQAEDMLKVLAREAPDDDFVRDLADAVRRRGTLPSLDRLPLSKF